MVVWACLEPPFSQSSACSMPFFSSIFLFSPLVHSGLHNCEKFLPSLHYILYVPLESHLHHPIVKKYPHPQRQASILLPKADRTMCIVSTLTQGISHSTIISTSRSALLNVVLHIFEVLGSDLSLEIAHLNRVCHGFSKSIMQMLAFYIKLCPNHFIPHN